MPSLGPISVPTISLGCWPIAGVTSIGVTREDSLATVRRAVECGVTHLDTAHAYGYDGESERVVGEVVRSLPDRDAVTVATKGGLVWGPDDGSGEKRSQSRDGRPSVIRAQAEESLKRLGLDHVDIYYLHAPDPNVPVEESAGAIAELVTAGKARAAGVSNFKDRAQYEAFASVCPIAVDQQPYNMLQRGIEADRVPWAREFGAGTAVYWPLMKGFLAGKLPRDHVFETKDSRRNYPVFQGEQWERTHDFLDRLRPLCEARGCTIAQLALAWTAEQPAVTTALCGAKRPEQIEETARAMEIELTEEERSEILSAVEARGDVG